jgi:hypothetical protein
MALPERGLAQLQEWMHRVVANPARDLREALDAESARVIVAPGELDQVILPSRTLTSAERLGIYHGMYPARMQEALESDYPALAHFLGATKFGELVRAYVAVFPSRSYTLNRLGDHFPEYVASHPGLRRQAFCADLARLERAVAQVFDAPESPVLEAEAIAAAGERIAEARVRPVAAFQLLALRYPANEYLQSVRDETHEHPRAAAKNTWIAVFRRSYVVRRLDLAREPYGLLAALAGGDTVGHAVERTLRSSRRAPAPDQFFRWFRDWAAAGMFQSLDL